MDETTKKPDETGGGWDAIVKELMQISGDLARLHAASIGAPEIARQIQIAAMHVARAAGLALPRSRYGRTEP